MSSRMLPAPLQLPRSLPAYRIAFVAAFIAAKTQESRRQGESPQQLLFQLPDSSASFRKLLRRLSLMTKR